MLEIQYNEHLMLRIKSRKVPADEYYYDNITKHYIAIKETFYNEKIREYLAYADYIEIITIHPLKKEPKRESY